MAQAPDGTVVGVPDRWLELIPPPLPAEPEPGVYDIGGICTVRPALDERPDRWCTPSNGVTRDRDDWQTWEETWAQVGGAGVTIRRLVPEPAPSTVDVAPLDEWPDPHLGDTPTESTIPPGQVRYACDHPGCTTHIAGPDDAETLAAIQEHEEEHRADDERDGPIPFPGDDVAERLPSGGWRARLSMLDKALRERMLPEVAPASKQSCRCRVSDGGPGAWYCTQFHVAGPVWHIATINGFVTAVWRAKSARQRADRDQADNSGCASP